MERSASDTISLPNAVSLVGSSLTGEAQVLAIEEKRQTTENIHDEDIDMTTQTQIQVLEHRPVQDAVRLIEEESNDFDVRSEVLTHTVLKNIYPYILYIP